jgi:acyl carrier protein
MENINQIQQKVRQFIQETSYIDEDQINNDSLIFVQGIMDSMGFISIIDYIEENFSVTANDDELIESNFESINAISDFILRKMKSN